ncbi:MAG: DUF188 domain-containing protein, partial [Pseudomonadales bacterium]|nr:DUF188 domain-containing protein [Pseudomonadales bacterium]
MTIWVDADACPVPIREILLRAAGRTGIELVLVANRPPAVPPRHNVRTLAVPQGFDAADQEI